MTKLKTNRATHKAGAAIAASEKDILSLAVMSEPDTLIEVYRARIEAARELLDRAEAHLDLGSRCVNTLAKQVQLSGALKAIQRVSSIVAVASNDAADATSLKALSGDHPVAWPKSRSALAAGSSAKAG